MRFWNRASHHEGRARLLNRVAVHRRDVDRGRRTSIQLQNDPLFTAIPFSLQPNLVATHIERLDDQIKPWKISNIDRRRHGAFAMQWLAKISSDRERYYFYRISSDEQSQLTMQTPAPFLERPGPVLIPRRIFCSFA